MALAEEIDPRQSCLGEGGAISPFDRP